jgi:hypothetical protein
MCPQERKRRRVFVDALFEHFMLYCKKNGIKTLACHSSQKSESVYIVIEKKKRKYKVRISTHEQSLYTREQCDFNLTTGDTLFSELVRFSKHFNIRTSPQRS